MGARIKRIRVLKNLSLREAAEAAGIPVSTFREWESGRQIKGEPYEKIARALDVSLYELLTGRKVKPLDLLIELQNIENACRALRKSLESYNIE